MPDLLPPPHLMAAFVMASFVLAVTPGPAVLYIITRSLTQGRLAGLVSVLAVALGNLGNALGAALGLAALFAVSALAFTVVKYLGAAYLIWLGIQAIRAARRREPATAAAPPAAPLRRIFLDGFLVALLNPKTTLFFAAFLPQFLDPAATGAAPTLVLGAAFAGVAAISDTAYALTAGWARPMLGARQGLARLGGWASGIVYLGLGLLAALGHRPTRA